MARPLLPDDLWAAIPRFCRPTRLARRGGPPVDDRAALTGILFVLLRSGIPWEMLPAEMKCGCGMSCWRGCATGKRPSVWRRLHQVLRRAPTAAGEIDWSRERVVDSARVRARRKGVCPPARTRRTGARRDKRHLITDGAWPRRSASF